MKPKLDDAIRLALQTTIVPREELFITTKFWPQFARDPALCLDQSLKKAGLEYVDLYLMHWPVAFVATTNLSEAIPNDELGKDGIEWLDFSAQKPAIDKEYSENLHLIWKKMEDIYRQGKAKSLGVSNFSIKNLEKLLPHVSPDIPLTVNQVEAHPWFPNAELIEYCKSRNIQVQDFSPLGGRLREGRERLVEDRTVKTMAEKRGCAIGQLLQSWAVQRGTIPLGRSSNPERVASNFAVVRLSGEEMQVLDALDRGEKGRTVNPDWGWEIFN
jgi:glycerol 2-dehydrogenase (NADP+)